MPNARGQMLRRVDLPEGVTGQLWLHSMPGRWERLSATLQAMESSRISTVVCLVPREEIEAKSPDYARALEAGPPWTHIDLPVHDYGIPRDPDAFFREARAIAERLRSGQHVLVHCAAGVGRTGTFACVVLRALGLSPQQATEVVRQARAEPESDEQRGLVQDYR